MLKRAEGHCVRCVIQTIDTFFKEIEKVRLTNYKRANISARVLLG